MEKPMCQCGVCKVCKTRERVRKYRAQKKEMSAPAVKPAARPDNIVVQPSEKIIWIDGNDSGYGSDNLQGLMWRAERKIDQEIRDQQDQVNSFTQKERRGGKLYWYRWTGGAWKYYGPVGKGEDPRIPFQKRISELELELQGLKTRMQSCVIKKLGNHLLIDAVLFKTHVDKSLPGNIIKVKDVIA